MKWFLLWALGTTGAVIVALCIVVLFARHRFRRRHRVDHRVATAAPVTWLFDPRAPARLHRRLARIGSTATAVAEDHRPRRRRDRRAHNSPLTDAADDLCARAVALDHQLARVAVLAPDARRQPLAALAEQVAHLEAAAARLVGVSAEARTPRVLVTDDPAIADVRGQLDRLAQAQQELDALDVEAGLTAAPAPAPPPAASRQAPMRGSLGRR